MNKDYYTYKDWREFDRAFKNKRTRRETYTVRIQDCNRFCPPEKEDCPAWVNEIDMDKRCMRYIYLQLIVEIAKDWNK